MEVKELSKGVYTRCEHLMGSKGQGCCSIYKDRPQGCVSFQCLWLVGAFSNRHRPDKSGIVAFTDENTIVLAETREGMFNTKAGIEIQLKALEANKKLKKPVVLETYRHLQNRNTTL